MKKNIFLLICLVSGFLFNAQTPTFQWAKSFNGESQDIAFCVTHDSQGNVYTTGFFSDTVDFDPGPGVFNLYGDPSGGDGIFVSKLDAAGNFVWAKSFIAASIYNHGMSVAVDATGNVYTVGYFENTCDFDPGPGTYTLNTAYSINTFISKLDNMGNFVWAKQLESDTSSMFNFGYDIKLDVSGNIYLAGLLYGTVDFDPGPATYTLIGFPNNYDIFIEKLDGAGNFVWAKQFGGNANDDAVRIIIDSLNNVYATGMFKNSVDFDPGPGIFNLTSAGDSDCFILKLNAAGNFAWAKSFGGPLNDYDWSIGLDASGNILTAGWFSGTADFDPGPSIANLTAIGSQDFFILKLDSIGNFVWAKSSGGTSFTSIRSLDTDINNNIYVSGVFAGTSDFDPGAGVSNLISSNGSPDIFISKLDSNGTYLWAERIGSTGFDYPNKIDVDQNYNIYTTGYFNATVDFDPFTPVYNLTAGYDGVFVHKMSQCIMPTTPINTTASSLVCENSAANLSASSTGTINWYATSTSTAILATGIAYTTPTLSVGTYTFYAAAINCTVNPLRTAVTITVLPLPHLFVSNSPSIICPGDNAILSVTGAQTYTWLPAGTGTSTTVSPTITTTYTVYGTDFNGCLSNSIITQSVLACTDIMAINNNGSSVKIYPNPVNDILTIESTFEIQIIITNTLGQEIFHRSINNRFLNIDLYNQSPGIYFIKILEKNKNLKTQKILKQ